VAPQLLRAPRARAIMGTASPCCSLISRPVKCQEHVVEGGAVGPDGPHGHACGSNDGAYGRSSSTTKAVRPPSVRSTL